MVPEYYEELDQLIKMVFIPNFGDRVKLKIKKILFDRFEYKNIIIEDQKAVTIDKEIPNTVYQTWVNKSLPWRLGKGILKFREANKNYSFKIFSHEDRDEYMQSKWSDHPIYKIYRQSNFHQSKADIWRYCIIYEKGGFYFDIKSACAIPLDNLIISKGSVISYESNMAYCVPNINIIENQKYPFHLILNWAFGFKRKHQLLKMLINNIVDYSEYFKGKEFNNPKEAILSFTGPGMLTKTFRDYISLTNVRLIPMGIDFNQKGIFQLEGSEFRYKYALEYGKSRNKNILN